MRSLLLFLALALQPALATPPRIRLTPDHLHFTTSTEAPHARFEVWGANYDHDAGGRLLEDYWEAEWPTVAADFREMQALGFNVIRVHLQLGRFLETPERPHAANLKRLGALVKLAEELGLYLDLTGLACYHKKDVPEWYDALDEKARWDVQARFWKAVAEACHQSPAVFCFDLMNEPVIGGAKDPRDWLAGPPLGDKYFVQRIATDARGRTNQEIARAWVEHLTAAIREVDSQTLLTVGEIPWGQAFPGAKPLFSAPEVGRTLDFVAIHLYPRSGKAKEDLEVLRSHLLGKPLVIEEIFPLSASQKEAEAFIGRARPEVDGWVSFYWGRSADEYEKLGGLQNATIGAWLRRFPALRSAP